MTASLLRWRALVFAPLVTLALVVAACERPLDITGPTGELLAHASDGAHGGNPHFFFLPPIARHDGDFTGVFDGSLAPVVDICQLDGTECVASVAHFTTSPRRVRGEWEERVRAGEHHYSVTWRTHRFHLDPANLYRICVSVGPRALGHADVHVRHRHDRTLPIKFRIEEGAVDAGVLLDQACASALMPAAIQGAKCLVSAEKALGAESRPSPNSSGARGDRGHDRDDDDDDDDRHHDGDVPDGRCERGAGLADWPISLSGTDDQGQSVSLTTATGAKGEYSFAGFRPGTYTVCEGAKPGFVQVFPTVGASCPGGTFGYQLELSSGQVVKHQDFGNQAGGPPPPPPGSPGRIEGTVMLPAIEGVSDPLMDWLIFLLDANGTELARTTSDVSGHYAFADLQAGTYRVCEDLPSFMTPDKQLSPLVGDPGTATCANGTIGYVVTLTAAGEGITGRDFINNLLF